MVNKGPFIIWLSGKVFLRDGRVFPSGQDSSILPALVTNHSAGFGQSINRSENRRLDTVIEDLEITDGLTGKSLLQIVQPETENRVAKIDSFKATPPLEMDEMEKQMSGLKEQYAALSVKRNQEMKEIEMKIAAIKKTSPGNTTNKGKAPQEIQTANKDGTILDMGSSLLRREFKISGQIGEPGQTEKLTFVSLTHQIDSGLKRGYQDRDIVDGAIIRSISPHSGLRRYIETFPDLTLAPSRFH